MRADRAATRAGRLAPTGRSDRRARPPAVPAAIPRLEIRERPTGPPRRVGVAIGRRPAPTGGRTRTFGTIGSIPGKKNGQDKGVRNLITGVNSYTAATVAELIGDRRRGRSRTGGRGNLG
jgi:hypothetical protein